MATGPCKHLSQDALALTLSGVKLLMTNFPFFYSCFLTNFVETKCGKNFEEAGQT